MKVLLLAGTILFAGQAVLGQPSDKQTLINCSQIWLDAIHQHDTTKLSQVMAPEFTMITPSRKWTRKALLTALATNRSDLSGTIDSVKVQLVGEGVGLLTGYLTWSGTENGEKKTSRSCYQDVFIKRGKRWYDVSSHVLQYEDSSTK